MSKNESSKLVSDKLFVLVTGATGQQGGAVAHVLLEKGHSVRVFTRNSESSRAIELENLGAEIFKGDFNDNTSVESALKNMDAVFAMGSPFEGGVDVETKHGKILADAAKKTGIKHFVYSSVESANRNTGIPHFESKFKVEEHIRKIGIPYTIVRPVYFMENFIAPWVLPGLKEGRIATPMPPNRKLQMTSIRDIGSFVGYILERREDFLGKSIDLASDEISGKESAEILSRIIKRDIKYFELTYDQISAMGEDMIKMYKWFNELGYSVDITKLHSEFLDIKWHKFEVWVRKQDWSVLEQLLPQVIT